MVLCASYYIFKTPSAKNLAEGMLRLILGPMTHWLHPTLLLLDGLAEAERKVPYVTAASISKCHRCPWRLGHGTTRENKGTGQMPLLVFLS